MNAHPEPRQWKPTPEEQRQAIEILLCSDLDRDTRAVIRDIEEKLAEKNHDTDRA